MRRAASVASRRQKQPNSEEPRILNKQLEKQGNVMTPVIIALALTLFLLVSSDSERPDIALPNIKERHKEELIQVPKEQAQLEVDRIVAENEEPVERYTQQLQLVGDGPMTPSLHNVSSLVQHIWYRGEKIDQKTKPCLINTTFPLAIDALSVATETSLVTLEGQVKTWGSHHSIRYLFGATELDDADPTCAQNITLADMQKISAFCSGRAWRRANPRVKFLRNRFVRGDFMVRFQKTPGWMCSLTRMPHAVGKIGRFYRRELAQPGSTFTLPDFLLLQDDDTYYNMLQLYPFLEKKDPSRATAFAGCLVRLPIAEIAFDYPDGGFGLILSKASLEKWIQLVDCENQRNDDAWEKKVCMQIKENLIGEGYVWKNGMSITDLMAAYAAKSPFANYNKWKIPGYCIHGDWALGYFINYYGISEQSSSFNNANEFTRIEQILGYHYDKRSGNCRNEGQALCTTESHVCHRLHGVSMMFVARVGKQNAPEQFRALPKMKA